MADEQFYSVEDYKKIPKVDAHVHYNSPREDIVDVAVQNGFRLISINTKIPGFPSIYDQNRIVEGHASRNKTLFHLTTFDAEEVISQHEQTELTHLKNTIGQSVGFKVWKDIGMVIKDNNGEFVFIDDNRFDSFFAVAELNGLPVLGHIGEPRNCWLPLEEMTVNNDRNYFRQHPEYHMFLHPEFPSYERLIESYESMLSKHPSLQYIGAHFGSLEWNIDEVAKRLDKFPNMAVDTAERISHIQYQAGRRREEGRNFFMRYQDRIIYGTDLIVDDATPALELKDTAEKLWLNDWKFFTSDEQMTSPLIDNTFTGLQLPSHVVEKIFCKNAERWYKLPAL